jgi:hypothetical protein
VSDEHKHDIRTDLDVAAALVGVVDTDMPIFGITTLQVMQADGSLLRLFHVHGEPLPHMEQIVGLLEMTKIDLAIDYRGEDDDDDDPP